MSATIKLFSELPYPISGKARNKKGEVVGEYLIVPGDNHIDEEVWAVLKEDPRIQKRIDERRLRPKYNALQRDIEELRNPASRAYIRELCAKSKGIQDGELFGAPKGDLQSQIKKLQAELDRIKALG